MTGDVARIFRDGSIEIVDRSKDVIKSGGEWISSVAIENAALDHPSVQQAAVIAMEHPRWQERPLLMAVLRPGTRVTRDEIARPSAAANGAVVAAGRCAIRRCPATDGDGESAEDQPCANIIAGSERRRDDEYAR